MIRVDLAPNRHTSRNHGYLASVAPLNRAAKGIDGGDAGGNDPAVLGLKLILAAEELLISAKNVVPSGGTGPGSARTATPEALEAIRRGQGLARWFSKAFEL